MVQFALPKNSTIEKGKHFSSDSKSKNLKTINVYRWNPEDTKNPRVDSYELDMDQCGPMVLDVLIKIKNEICLLSPFPTPRDQRGSRIPSSVGKKKKATNSTSSHPFTSPSTQCFSNVTYSIS